MAEIKSFTFADEPMAVEDIAGQFELNGTLFDVRKLKDSALPVLMHKVRNGQPNVVLAAALEFVEVALTPESAKFFIEKHLSPVTGLKLGQIIEVLSEIMAVVARGTVSDEDVAPTKARPVKRTARA